MLNQNEIKTQTIVIQQENSVPEQLESGLLTINGTLLFVMVSFAIFTLIMQKVFYGPMTQIRKKRAEYIQTLKKESQENAEKAEEFKNEYTQRINETEQTVAEKTAAKVNEAEKKKAAVIETKRNAVAKHVRESKEKILEEKQNTLLGLKEEISNYAFDISKKILGEEIPLTDFSSESIDNTVNR